MNSILQWAIGSTWFKKTSGIVGGFAAGWLFSMTYWRQVKGTLEVWGIERSTLVQVLEVIVAAAGIGGSIGLSVAKKKRERTP